MLKLKYLIDNRALVRQLLDLWNDDGGNPELLDRFRISANAVYPFISGETLCFLRFSPIDEKCPDDIRAELDYLEYLRTCNYPAPRTLPSKNGRALEVAETPWGVYAAVVFEGAPGRRADQLPLTDEIIAAIGRALGQLHRVSASYRPAAYQRGDWSARLDWIRAVLSEHPEETPALEEEALLRRRLSEIPVTPENFGLIHYDFEPDNLFFNEVDGSVHPIDFDDAVYHWYVMDIVQALESLKEELPESAYDSACNCFLAGYRSETEPDAALLTLAPVYKRFAGLYSYARILRAIGSKPDVEPDWMPGLVAHLSEVMRERRRLFGSGWDV